MNVKPSTTKYCPPIYRQELPLRITPPVVCALKSILDEFVPVALNAIVQLEYVPFKIVIVSPGTAELIAVLNAADVLTRVSLAEVETTIINKIKTNKYFKFDIVIKSGQVSYFLI